MNYIFGSLICHRDVDMFSRNWLVSRIHLADGFRARHLILHDGSLTSEDIKELRRLPLVTVDPRPATLYPGVNPAIGKLSVIDRAFAANYDLDRVILIDSDVFFLRPWDAALCQLLTSNRVVVGLRDWGECLGPAKDAALATLGVSESIEQPGINTGILSVDRESWPRIAPALQRYLATPEPRIEALGDQLIVNMAFQSRSEHVNGISTVVAGAEDPAYEHVWSWYMSQAGVHINGLSSRPRARDLVMAQIGESCPRSLPLSRFPADLKLIYGQHDHTRIGAYPSAYKGRFVMDALYPPTGTIHWNLPPQATRISTTYVSMDSNPEPLAAAVINGIRVDVGQEVSIELTGSLTIDSPLGHIAYLSPTISVVI